MNQGSKARERKLSAASLTRWAGLFLVLAGILYILIQLIHPADDLSSVNSQLWVIVACLTMVMSLSSLIGITGIYTRQVEESGWLGLFGWIMFGLFWLISAAFSFVEAFVLPLLTTDAPKFVEGMTGIFGGTNSEADLGIFQALAPIAGVMYILGGLLFGIATFRAKVHPPLGAVLLAVAAVATVAAAIIPHPYDRILAVPMGIAQIWLGVCLYFERRRMSEHGASK
ncbi:hypothetical protein [Paenibacillus sp.]|uniref:hypothetical protein n=1 Tax=Paenibacillus sp. TaxID=58172 RepID=UPI002D46BB43|nr:hypothetical protein [Paenibacillus sp.]HZG84850.1 hypothetical protein [Paenibacillus sp.]